MFFYEWTGATEVEMWDSGEPEYCLDNINAYTVAELGEMLPLSCESGKNDACDWYCATIANNLGWKEETFTENTEADARAKMLIYLIENKLVDVSALG
ncbi:MAG: hypothetical protein P4M09_17410 [Devosia sp.]|nr:hypothetical protein [Devosia sp.]